MPIKKTTKTTKTTKKTTKTNPPVALAHVEPAPVKKEEAVQAPPTPRVARVSDRRRN